MQYLPHWCSGPLGLLLYALNTLFWFVPLALLALVKLLVPFPRGRALVGRGVDLMATAWVAVNTLIQRATTGVEIDVRGLAPLSRHEWYLVVANHQSWVDILVLQRVFHRRIPFLKFFLKRELLWVPILGLAWWGLDFPFMRRYSRELLAKRPELRGKDVATTRRACAKFSHLPVSIINFVEGTRFTPAKHQAQQSPYRHLLLPRAGGIAHVLACMGGQLHQLVDVTIHYPAGIPSFYDFVAGRVKRVEVQLNCQPITPELIGDYQGDDQFQRSFQNWVNTLWLAKDRQLAAMHHPEQQGG